MKSIKKRLHLLSEFWDFMRIRKMWWMAPIIVLLLLAAVFIVAGGSTLSPFIYALF